MDNLKVRMKKLSDEIHFRNMLAMIHQEAVRQLGSRGRKAAAPEVGIFWIDQKAKKIYERSVPLREAEDYSGFKIYPGGHMSEWHLVQTQNPAWRDHQYDEVPRGRVLFDNAGRKPVFIVRMGREFDGRQWINDVVESAFNLPAGMVQYDFDDEHYQDIGEH